MTNEAFWRDMKRQEDIELGRPVEQIDYISEHLPSFARQLKQMIEDNDYLDFNYTYELALHHHINWEKVIEHCKIKGYEIKEI